MPRLSSLIGGGIDTFAAMGGMKPSIILFDTRAGARTFTVPNGVTSIRAFVVGAGGDAGGSRGGAGGGYSEKVYSVSPGDVISYTVGSAPGGTSSFSGPGGGITATGGADGNGSVGAAGGSGSGGDINTDGGSVTSTSLVGGASGCRFGDGFGATNSSDGGSGWGAAGIGSAGGTSGGLDGFGVGLIPGVSTPYSLEGLGTPNYSYGVGGNRGQSGFIGGGGGRDNGTGGIGGGAGAGAGGTAGKGGFGLVGVEALA